MNREVVIALIVIAWSIACFVVGRGSIETPDPVVIVEIDTLFSTSKPDTVTLVEWRKVPVVLSDTVIVSRDSILVVRDTVFVEKPWFYSEKQFTFPYIKSKVGAWSFAPVDTFENTVIVDWQRHYTVTYKPEEDRRAGNLRRKWLGIGLGVGVLGTTLLLK